MRFYKSLTLLKESASPFEQTNSTFSNFKPLPMRNYRLLKPIYTSLLALMILTACNGQTNAVSKTEKVDELQSTLAPAPKIKKPQDKNTNKTIHCGLVDQQGNIWFGTTGEGVFRYDGKLFTQFTMKDGLSSNCIWSIMEDRSGTIWNQRRYLSHRRT